MVDMIFNREGKRLFRVQLFEIHFDTKVLSVIGVYSVLCFLYPPPSNDLKKRFIMFIYSHNVMITGLTSLLLQHRAAFLSKMKHCNAKINQIVLTYTINFGTG